MTGRILKPMEFLKADHLLRLNIPDLQAQAADDFKRMQRGGLGFRQLRYLVEDFRQAIEGDAGVQVMNMMIADVGREPSHDAASLHKAGGLQRRFFIGPAIPAIKDTPGKLCCA